MLYEIAHVIKERFGFLWDAIECFEKADIQRIWGLNSSV